MVSTLERYLSLSAIIGVYSYGYYCIKEKKSSLDIPTFNAYSKMAENLINGNVISSNNNLSLVTIPSLRKIIYIVGVKSDSSSSSNTYNTSNNNLYASISTINSIFSTTPPNSIFLEHSVNISKSSIMSSLNEIADYYIKNNDISNNSSHTLNTKEFTTTINSIKNHYENLKTNKRNNNLEKDYILLKLINTIATQIINHHVIDEHINTTSDTNTITNTTNYLTLPKDFPIHFIHTYILSLINHHSHSRTIKINTFSNIDYNSIQVYINQLVNLKEGENNDNNIINYTKKSNYDADANTGNYSDSNKINNIYSDIRLFLSNYKKEAEENSSNNSNTNTIRKIEINEDILFDKVVINNVNDVIKHQLLANKKSYVCLVLVNELRREKLVKEMNNI